MNRLAFDLRCLPRDGSPGAGIAHAGRELWSTCLKRAPKVGIELTGFVVGNALVDEGVDQIERLSTSRAYTLIRRLYDRHYRGLFSVSGAIPWGVSLPTFPWVHDLAIFDHPDWFPQSWLQRQLTTRLFLRGLKQAHHIFCVSEEAARSVQRRPNLKHVSLSITSEGTMFPPRVSSYAQREDMAIIVGSVEPRKNIPFIVNLWPEVCRRVGRPLRLVIAGQTGWGNVVIPNVEGVERVTHLSEEKQLKLLQTARLTLVPSLYEGFGRVALEAMAYGCPVIASSVGGHLEIVNTAGKLVHPADREGWVRSTVDLFTQPKEWETYHILGRERARAFSWERVADHILALIARNW